MKTKTKIKKGIIRNIKRVLGLSKKPIKRQYFTREVKEAVLRFQKYRCAVNRCGFHRASWRFLQFDHIRNRDDNSMSNCQALCPFHHSEKTKRDARKKHIEQGLNGKGTKN